MRHFKVPLISLGLFTLLLYTGCINIEENQEQTIQLTYESAKEMAIQYLTASGYYEVEFKVLDDPDNVFWNSYSSLCPKILDDFGLKKRNYYAVCFYIESVREGGATVFVDKDESRLIGVLYDYDRFEKIEASESN